jgi:hypothetical protein
MKNLKVIGYWEGPETVKPIDFNWKRTNRNLLERIEDFLNPDNVKQNGFEVISYRGMSTCRICNKWNGSREYRGHGLAIPQGYLHYILEHGLIPDPALINCLDSSYRFNFLLGGGLR